MQEIKENKYLKNYNSASWADGNVTALKLTKGKSDFLEVKTLQNLDSINIDTIVEEKLKQSKNPKSKTMITELSLSDRKNTITEVSPINLEKSSNYKRKKITQLRFNLIYFF